MLETVDPSIRSELTTTVRFRPDSEVDTSEVALVDANASVLAAARPWREFRWRAGQKHYSGTYWSATDDRHVIYESRLELARVLFADFDRSVHRICAQPFLLAKRSNDVERKHIPDYLLITDQGPKVVDIKPAHRLSRPEVVDTFAWTRAALERRGWIYEVWSEPNEVELQNIRFLAGFRRSYLFDPSLLVALRSIEPDGASIAETIRMVPDWPLPLTRAALLHLLWSQEFAVDLCRPLRSSSTLTRKVTI